MAVGCIRARAYRSATILGVFHVVSPFHLARLQTCLDADDIRWGQQLPMPGRVISTVRDRRVSERVKLVKIAPGQQWAR